MTNLVKKIQVGNPLFNLGLTKLLEEYESAKTDEEIVTCYNRILTCVEGSTIAEALVYDMIAFSTGIDVNPVYLLMQKTLVSDEN